MEKHTYNLILNINQFTHLFEKSRSIDEFLDLCVQLIAENMKSDVCSIYLCDKSSKTLILRATYGLNKEYVGRLSMKEGEGLVGNVLKTKTPVLEKSGSINPKFKLIPGINEESYEAFLAVPILLGLKEIGVLTLQHKQAGYFDKKDMQALITISSQIASFLENAKLLIELNPDKTIHKLSENKSHSGFLKVLTVNEGIAWGNSFKLLDRKDVIFGPDKEYQYNQGEHSFVKALNLTKLQIEELQDKLEQKTSDFGAFIFSSHLLMLTDSSFTGRIQDLINKGKRTEAAVSTVVNHFIELFKKSDNQRIREKVHDICDIGHRILQNLSKENVSTDYSENIIIAGFIYPSELIKITSQNAKGIILYKTGLTAHISVLARSLDIPVVCCEDDELLNIEDHIPLILDGTQGTIFINPEDSVKEEYEKLKSVPEHEETQITESVLAFGEQICIGANINLLSDLQTAVKVRAQSIGLYRSEFPFIIRSDFPTEEEQIKIYKKLFDSGFDKVTIRTLDIGGDKFLSYFPDLEESNPFLGLRAIRFSLKYKNIFKTQLRAILRASTGYEVKILFPFISNIDDFKAAKAVLIECINELKNEKLDFNSQPETGTMIELPSAVFYAEQLAEISDFITVGTNDLIQYLMAVDRTNTNVQEYYSPFQPAVLKALKIIADAAELKNCSISVCGDAVEDPDMLKFFIGLGIRNFSAAPRKISRIRKELIQINIKEAAVSSEKMLSLSSMNEIKELLKPG
jgi:phosphotransferase system, enzyme I, PtsP